MNRRRLLQLLGLGGVAGVGRMILLPPSRSRTLEDTNTLARRLYDSFDDEDRKLACVDYDHPYRQYHNRGVWGGGISGFSLGWEQRGILTDLLHAGLSEVGQSRVPNEQYLDWPGIHLLRVLFCGDPRREHQIILTGPHLNLRLGGKSREGVAFGGPQVYGDQRGDGELGLPGNLYRDQLELGRRLFDGMTRDQRAQATIERAPIQTQIELQGSKGAFTGVPIALLAEESKQRARELVDGILANYPATDVAYANRCLEATGGIDALFATIYSEGEGQIFRLEGPAAVFYFRGYPHVHAFINVAMSGDAPLSVGEMVGENPSLLEQAQVKALFERAMCEATGADRAHYEPESVVGKLRPGTIRTGDIYNLESWQDRIAIVDGVARAGSRGDIFLRDATIAHLKRRGFVS